MYIFSRLQINIIIVVSIIIDFVVAVVVVHGCYYAISSKITHYHRLINENCVITIIDYVAFVVVCIVVAASAVVFNNIIAEALLICNKQCYRLIN